MKDRDFFFAILLYLFMAIWVCPPAHGEDVTFVYSIEILTSKERAPVQKIHDNLPEDIRRLAMISYRRDKMWHLDVGLWRSEGKGVEILLKLLKLGYDDAKLYCTNYVTKGCYRYAVSQSVVYSKGERPNQAIAVSASTKGEVVSPEDEDKKALFSTFTSTSDERNIIYSPLEASQIIDEQEEGVASGCVEAPEDQKNPAASSAPYPGASGEYIASKPPDTVASENPPSPTLWDHVDGNDKGNTGLVITPSARIINDGDTRLTVSQSWPYRHYSIAVGLIPDSELGIRLDEILTEQETGPQWEGYGNRKHRTADFKFRLLKEGLWIPEVSIGAQDFFGDAVKFACDYMVASKRLGSFDVTAGYGGHFFSSIFGRQNTTYRELQGIFGGIEWRLSPQLSLLAEYDPTKTLATAETIEVTNHINTGVRYIPWKNVAITASQQRGNVTGVSLTWTYPFGEQITPLKPDPPYEEPIDNKVIADNNYDVLYRMKRLKAYIERSGFSQVIVMLSENQKHLYVEFENNKYLSEIKALGRVLRVCACQTPCDIEYVHVIIKLTGVPMVQATVNPREFSAFLNKKLSSGEMKNNTEVTLDTSLYEKAKLDPGTIIIGKEKDEGIPTRFDWIGFQPYLNDMSGFFKFRVGPTVNFFKRFGHGLTAESEIQQPVYNTISTRTPPLSPNPVRSDFVKYLERSNLQVNNLFLNQLSKVGNDGFARIILGYPEYMYAAGSLEYMKTFGGGNYGLGAEVTYAQKRSINSIMGLINQTSFCPFVKAYAYIPGLEGMLEAKVGTYLAGDSGGTVTFSRYFRGGNIYIWYTKTNTANLTAENQGYADKGIGFSLPIRVFSDHDSRDYYADSWTPWTRDAGQTVNQPYVKDMFFFFTPAYIYNHWDEILQ